MAKKVKFSTRRHRYASRHAMRLSQKMNAYAKRRRLPLEPINPESVKVPKKRKPHKDRL